MRKYEKIKQNYEFRRLYGRGRSFVTPYFVLYALKTKRNGIRLGITAGKKIGGAVQRNRAKRVITAAFSNCLPHLPCCYDFCIVARSRILNVKSTDVEVQLRLLLTEGGLWSDEETVK